MKNIVIAAVVALVVSLGVCALFPKTVSHVAGAITSPATELAYLNLEQALGFGPLTNPAGSSSTNISGVRTAIVPNSFVLCSLQNPFNATSTLLNASLNLTAGTSSAASIVFAVDPTATATTTAIGSPMAIAASKLATLQTSGIASTTDLGVPVGPNQFVNIGTTAGSAVGYAYTFAGSCNGLFESAN